MIGVEPAGTTPQEMAAEIAADSNGGAPSRAMSRRRDNKHTYSQTSNSDNHALAPRQLCWPDHRSVFSPSHSMANRINTNARNPLSSNQLDDICIRSGLGASAGTAHCVSSARGLGAGHCRCGGRRTARDGCRRVARRHQRGKRRELSNACDPSARGFSGGWTGRYPRAGRRG